MDDMLDNNATREKRKLTVSQEKKLKVMLRSLTLNLIKLRCPARNGKLVSLSRATLVQAIYFVYYL